MTTIISRDGWNARTPRSTITTTWTQRIGVAFHHSAGPTGQTPRQIQDFHMDTRGWADVGYNWLVDHEGRIFEGRGWLAIGAHAANQNTAWIGICIIGDYRNGEDELSDAAKASARWLYEEACRLAGRTLRTAGHGQLPGQSTACPGDQLLAWLADGMPTGEQPVPSKPAPRPTPRPAPGPGHRFPLPSGYYFGPKTWGNRSVSGFYGRRFRGRTDQQWLQEFGRQLVRRGWPAGKGQRYLRRYGHDGRYGSEYRELIEAFQRDQGLTVDGLAGEDTWYAAYHNPVT